MKNRTFCLISTRQCELMKETLLAVAEWLNYGTTWSQNSREFFPTQSR